VRGQRISFADAPFISIEQRLWEPGEAGSEPRLRAWRIRPGDWYSGFQDKMLGLYLQALFHEDIQRRWRKRLGRHLTFLLRIASGQGDRVIQYSVSHLEQRCSLPFDSRHPDDSRQRLQQELDWLQQIGLVGYCDYVRPMAAFAQALRMYRVQQDLSQEALA